MKYRHKIGVYLAKNFGNTFDEGSYWYMNPVENKFFAEVFNMALAAAAASKAKRNDNAKPQHVCTEDDAASAFIKVGKQFEMHEPTLKRIGCTKTVLTNFFSQTPGATPPGDKCIIVPPPASELPTVEVAAAAVKSDNLLGDDSVKEEFGGEKVVEDSEEVVEEKFAAGPLVTTDDDTNDDDEDDDDDDSMCRAYAPLITVDDNTTIPAAVDNGEFLSSQPMETGASQSLDDDDDDDEFPWQDLIVSQPKEEDADAAAADAARNLVQQDIERLNQLCTLSKQIEMISSELAEAVTEDAKGMVGAHFDALQHLMSEQFQRANKQFQQASSQLDFLVGDTGSSSMLGDASAQLA